MADRPLITANQVTVVRLLPLPVCAWWLYQGTTGMWTAFAVGMAVACTDFVDGYLARKHGPTVLGGLLDPIADKVFIAAFLLPLADIGVLPAWAVALLLAREFVVTGIRSAFEQRALSMKTSYLAKVKTWVQMQAVGVILLVMLIPGKVILLSLFGAVVAGSVIVLIVVSRIRGALFVSGVIMAGLCAAGAGLYYALSGRVMVLVLFYFAVAITWASGLDYLINGIPKLRAAGDFNRADAARLVAAVLLPAAALYALVETPVPAAPLIALIAMELAVGGLDNLLSHHKQAASAVRWSSRALGAVVLLGASIAINRWTSVDPAIADGLVWAAMGVSVLGVALEFYRGRSAYLETAPA